MRDFTFNGTERPTLSEFNQRFSGIGNALNNLGNEYVWERSVVTSGYVETRVNVTGNDITSYPNDLSPVYSYSSSISFDRTTGVITLVNPSTIQREKYNAQAIADAIRGKYFSVTNIVSSNGQIPFDGIYFCNVVTARVDYFCIVSDYDEIGSEYFVAGTSHGYVNSPDPNAYPIDDGYTYTPLGMLGEKTRIETGSYVGTGKQGSSNKNSLTFNFEPMLLFIQARWTDSNGFSMVAIKPPAEAAAYDTHYMAHGMVNTVYATGPISFSGKNVSWYHNSYANQQLNQSGYQYRYIAIG